ncbi:MAG: carbohydrate ABC transporter permease [Christensenellales bacterium]|jgi:raffinose/stachyose/melibiose transport system permease protein
MVRSKNAGYYAFRFFGYLTLLFIAILSALPILWVIMSSFKSNGAILSSPFSLPDTFNFNAYESVLEQYSLLNYGKNSVIVSIIPTMLSLLCYAMSAYVIGKFKFPGKDLVYALFTITLLVPGHTRTQPIFSLIMNLNLYDTLPGLILVYLSGGLAMSLFVLRAAFMSVPMELNEAAYIDGANFFQVFFTVNLPLVKTGLSTAGVLMFLGNWNEYFYASLLTSAEKNRTLPVALSYFNQAFSYDYTRMFAALTLVVMPGIVIYMLAQEQVTASVATTGMKS